MTWKLVLPPLLLCLLLISSSIADESSPVAVWDFGAEQVKPLKMHGDAERDQAGPRPPEFPDFAETNTAVKLDGQGAHLVVHDPGPESEFDFFNGDAITLEAWVRLDRVRDGRLMYVIGKGRTGSPQFARDNQNWALRVVAARGVAKLSFLFATAPGGGDSHWHRWTSRNGFGVATGWHHVAVAYRFGQPDSVRGWIDGQPTEGAWDMGGATKEPPVVDDDAVWIGSSRGGSPSNSFDGWLDAVAIHREICSDRRIASRFRRVGGPRVVGPLPELVPDMGDVPAGRVLVTFHEALATHERWPHEGETWPEETARWMGDAFLLPRVPRRYDDWGIRASWKSPLLLRMAADVQLPAGNHSILLRARGLSRLWVDGAVIARTGADVTKPPDGGEAVTPLAQPPLPGLRAHGYHQQEVTGEVTISEKPQPTRVVLELVVGGPSLRTETGEVCVAVQTADGQSYQVLKPNVERIDNPSHAQPVVGRITNPSYVPLPLTNSAVEPAIAKIESSLAAYDDRTRRRAATSQDAFWRMRHDEARKWSEQNPLTASPRVGRIDNPSYRHSIDAFIDAKIQRALAAASDADAREARHFHGKVLPILREQCFRCHGEKDSGGLKLNARDLALKAGDSEIPAVVPGDAEASEVIHRIRTDDEFERMPPTDDGLSAEQIATLQQWIADGAPWPAPPVAQEELLQSAVIDDEAFLRRIFLDTVGVPPSHAEAEAFLASDDPAKRNRLLDGLLRDERMADHWMGFWLDLLAENPTLLNASLNSTGPFRWFVYDALRDNKPLDRMVTELILMRGSRDEGGSAGFALAGENDAPLAAKGHILASAFLGIELQCARCHDSPYHSTTQRDLFSLAAMLERKKVTVPNTSRVPAAFFRQQQARESLIRATLKPNEPVDARWPFAEVTGVTDNEALDRLMHDPADSRERLAALMTSPGNERFARVVVNRVWKQLVGAGLVEPVHDWEGRQISHPALLDWLARELVTHDYDLRHLIRLIVTSQTYQRKATGRNLEASPDRRFFNAPEPRRLTAEQIVDSLFAVTGSRIDVEELTFVHDGRRPIGKRQTLGKPRRAWMFASLNNERDRPSLSLPRARAVADVLEAFGWTGSRQKPIHQRDAEPNVLQPGVLANGTLTMTLTRAAYGSQLAQLAVDSESPGQLVDALFLRVLSRRPKPAEHATLTQALAEGFATRLVPANEIEPPPLQPALPLVTWFNHLQSEANTIQQKIERRVRQGPPPDPRLRSSWREVYEDAVWSLINHREFVWMP